ncbi:alpha/beta fold hydrolase [Streptomyces sp. TRM72054]|uniref:alpha/beta fold hydrolase n=1 Tax=Streptomyces sp. TRM72054 TaxID=2870562 RepID=UPI0021AB7A32|nr:alpha/beta fold hydrolase [Streptomyces sp. TRM72054]
MPRSRRPRRAADVLPIAGLGDPAEVWQAQLDGLSDRYRITAFDNRGAGRTPLPEGPLSVPGMADDAAALLRALDIPAAHIAGFSGHDTLDRLAQITAPALVLADELDRVAPPRLGRVVAEGIPEARFEVLPGQMM